MAGVATGFVISTIFTDDEGVNVIVETGVDGVAGIETIVSVVELTILTVVDGMIVDDDVGDGVDDCKVVVVDNDDEDTIVVDGTLTVDSYKMSFFSGCLFHLRMRNS